MNRTVKRIWNTFTTIIVAVVIIMALMLVGVRLAGFQVFSVLSGSMEPEYQTGSLIYVRDVEPEAVQVGQVITFVLDENLTVATHRVIDIQTGEDGLLRFYTKGDANESADGSPVHENNLLGSPVFTIPYLGYVASYIQNPPGTYIAIAAGAVILLLVFIPDLFSDDNGKKEKARRGHHEKGAHEDGAQNE